MRINFNNNNSNPRTFCGKRTIVTTLTENFTTLNEWDNLLLSSLTKQLRGKNKGDIQLGMNKGGTDFFVKLNNEQSLKINKYFCPTEGKGGALLGRLELLESKGNQEISTQIVVNNETKSFVEELIDVIGEKSDRSGYTEKIKKILGLLSAKKDVVAC